MTITGTSTHHQLMVAWALHDIETLTGPTPSREKAERVLREWRLFDAMTDAEIADVLAAYLPDEPPMVAGRDWLPGDLREVATADAALIVADLHFPATPKMLPSQEPCAWIYGCNQIVTADDTLLCPRHDRENAGRIA